MDVDHQKIKISQENNNLVFLYFSFSSTLFFIRYLTLNFNVSNKGLHNYSKLTHTQQMLLSGSNSLKSVKIPQLRCSGNRCSLHTHSFLIRNYLWRRHFSCLGCHGVEKKLRFSSLVCHCVGKKETSLCQVCPTKGRNNFSM